MSVTFSALGIDSDERDVNVSNGNAMRLLRALDLPVDGNDLCGRIDATLLVASIARTLRALDAGQAAEFTHQTTVEQHGGATMVNCGIDEAYIRSRLAGLLELAALAVTTPSRTICYG